MQSSVDVILLNWNNSGDTIECLESVFQLDYPAFRVIVCDNGSTDRSLDDVCAWADGSLTALAEQSPLPHPFRSQRDRVPFVRYTRAEAERGGDSRLGGAPLVVIEVGQNLGFAGGNNVALRMLLARNESEYVWLLNNDMVVAPESLSHMVALAERDEHLGSIGATLLEYATPEIVQAAGGGRLIPWQGLPREHSATGKLRRSSQAMCPDRLDFITMGCLLVRLNVVERVGLIDERYFLYCEDIDYSLRVRHAGMRIGFAPEAEVWHKGSASTVPGSWRHDYNMVRSALLLVHKFYPRLLPVAVTYSIVRCALPKVVRGQWRRLRAVMHGYRDFVAEVNRRRTPTSI